MSLPPSRVVVENVEPLVDGGRFAAKAVVGEPMRIGADVFCDGHDLVAAAVQVRRRGVSTWIEHPLRHLEQDRFEAHVVFEDMGDHELTVVGWIDRFATWRHGARRKFAAGVFRPLDAAVGAEIVRHAATRAIADRSVSQLLTEVADRLDNDAMDDDKMLEFLQDEHLAVLVRRFAEREPMGYSEPGMRVTVARPLAACSAWYELFPRSWGPEPGRHGTLRDVEKALPYVASMGFDVLYLPPIHPIGTTHRKGPNNSTTSQPGDPGSPWAIGSEEGGHTAIHPELGTIEDLESLVRSAKEHRLEVALDLAYQCSPDHPWVREHPEWFRHLPDGSIQPAENPPKRYEDVYPIDFETPAWAELWEALEDVVRFWISHGVRIFRVDNPHTKPFAFWEWMITRIHEEWPEVIFLSEAFTRPSVMYRLAKLGFDQSYTYFTWRQTPHELEQYLTELTQTEVAHFFRPNAWPNTPDILTEQLQWEGRPTFVTRLVLASTLFANYGIYGPAYELQEHVAREGVEEYVDNEKYQLRWWNLDAEHTLRPLIALLNRLRQSHAALRTNATLQFHQTDNGKLLCYSKTAPPDAASVSPTARVARPERSPEPILVVVNTDPNYRQSGFVSLDLSVLGIEEDEPFVVEDVVGGGRFRWSGSRNYVELDPSVLPAHVFVVRTRTRTEHDFDYF